LHGLLLQSEGSKDLPLEIATRPVVERLYEEMLSSDRVSASWKTEDCSTLLSAAECDPVELKSVLDRAGHKTYHARLDETLWCWRESDVGNRHDGTEEMRSTML
jgi:hypothetical protein